MNLNRRTLIQSATAAATAAVLKPLVSQAAEAAVPALKVPLGMDHFAVRAAGMKAAQLIDYAASLKLDTLFISELGPFESFDEAYLKGLKAQADAAGLRLYVGSMSICESSNTWKPTWGNPQEHLALIIRIAKTLGSPVARCVLGNQKDRFTDGGIDRHIENVIKVLKASKSLAEGEGIKIALENHAGDMQSHELKALIEEAGKSYVGVNIDPGNAVWALEEPMRHLEVLGPYTVCSSVRDSMVWEDADGAVVQWTAIGEGLTDYAAYAKRFSELAPGVPLQVETISGFAKPLNYLKPEFWAPFPKARAEELAAWISLAKRGQKLDTFKAPEDKEKKKEAEIAYQKGELERSLKWLREKGGCGIRQA
jgi:sugar phosphate isomerase/epimerase